MIKQKIQTVFNHFASQKSGRMDNPTFRKVLLECNLLPDELAINEIDIFFMSAKSRYQDSISTKGLTFEAFVHSLLLIAQSLQNNESMLNTSKASKNNNNKSFSLDKQLFEQFIDAFIQPLVKRIKKTIKNEPTKQHEKPKARDTFHLFSSDDETQMASTSLLKSNKKTTNTQKENLNKLDFETYFLKVYCKANLQLIYKYNWPNELAGPRPQSSMTDAK